MTSQDIKQVIHYLRRVFVGQTEVETFMVTMRALETEYARVSKEEREKVGANR